jgi:hypothetical protein
MLEPRFVVAILGGASRLSTMNNEHHHCDTCPREGGVAEWRRVQASGISASPAKFCTCSSRC